MSLHIYSARDQPATRFWVSLDSHIKAGIWETHGPRELLPTFCCKRRRIASNLIAHSYYDGTYFYCRKGKGCKQ